MTAPAAQPAPQRTTVLAVGLEQYDYGERMDLPGAAAQAVRFARWAHNRGVPAERIRLACTWLADKDSVAGAKVVGTSRDKLDQVLYELMDEGGDLLLLYWCGHGVAAEGGQSRRLYTSNATRASKANLPVEEIIRLLGSTHGKGFTRQVLIIDACANYVEEMSYDTGLPPGGFGKLTPRPVPQFVYFSTDLGQFAAYNPVEGRAEFSTAVFDWLDQQPAEPFLPNLETMFTQVDAIFTQRAASGQYTQRPVALQVKPFHGIERQHTHRAGAVLSLDVVEMHSSAFISAGLAPPQRWTAVELSRIALDPNPSRLSDLLVALRRAIDAKPVVLDMGVGNLGLGRLQVIYRQQVGAWPTGRSVDALLVEAAEADRSEHRRGAASSLRALARFVVGAAAALSLPPKDSPALADWIESLGHQLADAHQHYLDQSSAPSWLLIDLGKEPIPRATDDFLSTTPPWPTRITWTYTTHLQSTNGEPITGEATAVATKEGLAEALRTVFSKIPSSWPLLVDIAMPAALFSEGIERWPLFLDESLGECESLSDRYYPRLRWSQRRHDLVLHGRCVDRARRSGLGWDRVPNPMRDAVLGDESQLKRWIENTDHAWLIGWHPVAYRSDPLRVLLKEGFGFLIWFHEGVDTQQRRTITRTVSKIPVAARRSVIPDELAGVLGLPVVIWDDPRGRGETFKLPTTLAAEHIPML